MDRLPHVFYRMPNPAYKPSVEPPSLQRLVQHRLSSMLVYQTASAKIQRRKDLHGWGAKSLPKRRTEDLVLVR
jgi:hypothetical protein